MATALTLTPANGGAFASVLDPGLGLSVLGVAAGFGIPAGQMINAYYNPGGATAGEQAVFCLNQAGQPLLISGYVEGVGIRGGTPGDPWPERHARLIAAAAKPRRARRAARPRAALRYPVALPRNKLAVSVAPGVTTYARAPEHVDADVSCPPGFTEHPVAPGVTRRERICFA